MFFRWKTIWSPIYFASTFAVTTSTLMNGDRISPQYSIPGHKQLPIMELLFFSTPFRIQRRLDSVAVRRLPMCTQTGVVVEGIPTSSEEIGLFVEPRGTRAKRHCSDISLESQFLSFVAPNRRRCLKGS
ncbi:unnamed protein product [Caenorhabditis auriculariae]|uniref:Uncharacterized protein n=1 Tax=Caenorhabditis auriculariae TaxID=2777116 RepID=A0A8S1H855_9PELO|nr:unnamed protein product [Caenorhabditis auriculariae]